MRGPSSGTVGGEATRRSTEVTDDRPTGFRRNLIPERRRVGGEVPRALERARSRPAPADDRRAMDGAREAYPPAASGDPRDRGATWDRADGDPRGTGIRGDRGSRGECVRALGRLRGAQLPRARRRRTTRRRRQVPLGGRRQGRRGVRGRAQLARPRRGRPDRARLHVRRRVGGIGAAFLGEQEATVDPARRAHRAQKPGGSPGAPLWQTVLTGVMSTVLASFVVVVAAAAALAIPAPAAASVIRGDEQLEALVLAGSPGEANEVTVRYDSARSGWQVTDVVGITVQHPACVSQAPAEAFCRLPLWFVLGDGNDRFEATNAE